MQDDIPVVGPNGYDGGKSPADLDQFFAERRKTINSVIGAVVVLTLAVLGCATIVVIVLANNGVFGG